MLQQSIQDHPTFAGIIRRVLFLNISATYSSKMYKNRYQTIWCHNPEDRYIPSYQTIWCISQKKGMFIATRLGGVTPQETGMFIATRLCGVTVAYPGIFFGGGSTNSVEDRKDGDLGAVAP